MSEDNSIINAVKRLQRVGDQGSEATQKLRRAVVQVGHFITRAVEKAEIPNLRLLPMNYQVDYTRRTDGNTSLEKLHESGEFWFLVNPPFCPEDKPDALRIEHCIVVAQDVANGLLEKVAEALEMGVCGHRSAYGVLNHALEKPHTP